jgi:putative hydrolase of the HAD superfamily
MSVAVGTSGVLFDLDNTLFDHLNSVRSGIRAIRHAYQCFADIGEDELVGAYSRCLEEAYQQYLRGDIGYAEKDFQKVKLFFVAMGLHGPVASDIRRFREIYDAAYLESRRATPGSIETLVRLRENGYRSAIVSNGQIEDQRIKAEIIGVRHLVDGVYTSEEAGAAKPSRRLFELALRALRISPDASYMVGDSAEADIKGAIDVGLRPVLYEPGAQGRERRLFGRRVPLITRIPELLGILTIRSRRFSPVVRRIGASLSVRDLGCDIITTRRHCLHLSQDVVIENVRRMQAMFESVAVGAYVNALDQLSAVIESTARAAPLIDDARITIAYHGKRTSPPLLAVDACMVTRREFSVIAQYRDLRMPYESQKVALVEGLTTLLQDYCDNLMRDHPRAALRSLRTAMFRIWQFSGDANTIVVHGEGIED